MADGRCISTQDSGSLYLPICNNDKNHKNIDKIKINNVYYVPGLPKTLISVSMLNNDGFNVNFSANGEYEIINDKTNDLIYNGNECDGVFQ